jgi:hypothetical protein
MPAWTCTNCETSHSAETRRCVNCDMPSPDAFWERFPGPNSISEQLLQWQKDRLPIRQIAAVHLAMLVGIFLVILGLTGRPGIWEVISQQTLGYLAKSLILACIAEWLFMRLILKGMVVWGGVVVLAAAGLVLLL